MTRVFKAHTTRLCAMCLWTMCLGGMPAEAGDRFEDFQMLEKSAAPFAKDNPKIPVNGRSLLHSQLPSKTKNSFPSKKNKQSS